MSFEEDILIERFLKQELSKDELDSFLKRMDSDASFKEKVQLERQLFESLDEDSWSFADGNNSPEIQEYESLFASQETQKIKATISKVESDYFKKRSLKKRSWIISSVAAVIAVLLAVNIYLSSNNSNQDLFNSYLEDTKLLALVDRGDSNEFSRAQEFFDNKEFKKADSILSKLIDTTKNGNAFLYLALSQIHLNEYDQADNTLDQLIQSNLLDAQKAYWYKSLLYLRTDRIEESIEQLNIIIDNSYFKHKAAKELLDKIK